MERIRYVAAALLVVLCVSAVGSAATIVWTSFTFENNSGTTLTSSAGDQKALNADAPSHLKSITAGGTTYSNLIFASSATVGGTALVGDDMSVGVANQNTFDVTFAGSPSSVDNDFLLLTDFGGDDTFHVQLLGAGGLIGNQLTNVSNSSWPDIANNVRYDGTTSNEIQGAIVNLSDFGTGFTAADITGVRVFAAGGGTNQKLDPIVIGLVVPEPATLTLAAMGLGALLRRRRR